MFEIRNEFNTRRIHKPFKLFQLAKARVTHVFILIEKYKITVKYPQSSSGLGLYNFLLSLKS